MTLFTETEFQQRCMILLAAMIIDAIWGEPDWLWRHLPHPVVLFGSLIDQTSQRGNQRRFTGRQRRLNGIIAMALSGGIALVAGYMLGLLGPVVEVICLAILLAGHSLHQHVKAVADELACNLDLARRAIGMIVGRRTTEMTAAEICRAAIETDAENLSDGVIAPAIWFLIFGLPGLFLYKMINTADSMIGYKNERFYAFGWAAAKCDDVLNFLPARLTGGLIALASIGACGGIAAAVKTMFADAPKHASPNAGWPEAAMAGGLGIWLAGPRKYGSRKVIADRFNAAGRNAQIGDIAVGLRVAQNGQIILAALLLIASWPVMQAIAAQFGQLFD
jgi:adenosylcobinamide-phosphate synthase